MFRLRSIGSCIVAAVLLGACTSTGAFDPNAGARALGDLACISAVAGAYAEAKGVMPPNPTTTDVINVIKGTTGSGTAANVLNACSQMLANAGQDIAGLQVIIRGKAMHEGKPAPKLSPPPKRQGHLDNQRVVSD